MSTAAIRLVQQPATIPTHLTPIEHLVSLTIKAAMDPRGEVLLTTPEIATATGLSQRSIRRCKRLWTTMDRLFIRESIARSGNGCILYRFSTLLGFLQLESETDRESVTDSESETDRQPDCVNHDKDKSNKSVRKLKNISLTPWRASRVGPTGARRNYPWGSRDHGKSGNGEPEGKGREGERARKAKLFKNIPEDSVSETTPPEPPETMSTDSDPSTISTDEIRLLWNATAGTVFPRRLSLENNKRLLTSMAVRWKQRNAETDEPKSSLEYWRRVFVAMRDNCVWLRENRKRQADFAWVFTTSRDGEPNDENVLAGKYDEIRGQPKAAYTMLKPGEKQRVPTNEELLSWRPS